MGENKCVKKIEVSLEAQFNMADFTILFEILAYNEMLWEQWNKVGITFGNGIEKFL